MAFKPNYNTPQNNARYGEKTVASGAAEAFKQALEEENKPAQPAQPAQVAQKSMTADEKLARLKQIAISQRDQIRELDSRVMEMERTIANMQEREEAMALVLKNVAIHCGVDFRGIF